jgi:SAM-dependent methyltransferase
MTSNRQQDDCYDGSPPAFSIETPEGLALRVESALRAERRVSDATFDRLLPPAFRIVSGCFWTPLEVAARAARWLTELRVGSVVDIGSGVGKFCIAAALGSQCSFTGIEQRPRLVNAARALARLFGIEERVEFVTGVLGGIATPPADCYYLFNPFGENLFDPDERLSDDADLSETRYLDDIGLVERLLASAPVGTYVMTYNGFGGIIPDDYDEVRLDLELPCVLRMARRERLSGFSLPRAGRGWR